jgi:hypothetical protein
MPAEEARIAQMVLSSVFKKHMGLTFDMSDHYDKRVLNKGERRGTSVQYEDPREGDVTKEELFSLFNKLLRNKEYKEKMLGAKKYGKEFVASVLDKETEVNVVFKIAYQYRDKFPIFRIITIHRKKDFKGYATDDARFYV